MKHKFKINGLFFGLLIIAIAVSIILRSLDIFDIGIFAIIMIAVFAAIAIRSIVDLRFTGTLFAAGHILHLIDHHIVKFLPNTLSGWALILASTLLGIGLDIVFSGARKSIKRKHKLDNDWGINFEYNSDKDSNDDNVVYETDARDADEKTSTFSSADGRIVIDNAFGENSRYITDQNFVSASIDNGFGSLNVYFENVKMRGSQATLHIDNGFGKVNVYLPAAWRITLKEDAGFGKIKVNGTPSNDPEAPILYIDAETGFGDVNIYFG